MENPLSSDELDDAMEMTREQATQDKKKGNASDEVSTRSSKRKSNDAPQSPEKEMNSQDFVFQSPESLAGVKVHSQNKMSKLLSYNSQVRKKSGVSRQINQDHFQQSNTQQQQRPQSNSNFNSLDENMQFSMNKNYEFKQQNDLT